MTNLIAREFRAPEETISWAKDATVELEEAIRAFFDGDVVKVVTEFDPNTWENVQKVKFTADIPHKFRRKATEALINARHSFDQSIFAARNVLTGKQNKGVNYPWSQKPTDLDRLLRERGIDERLWDVIRDHQPYPTSDEYTGGSDIIRAIATIANNKHTVGLSVQGVIQSTRYPNITGKSVQRLEIMNPIWNPKKNEAELIRWRGDVKINGDYKFTFYICLRDPKLMHPVDVVYALELFIGQAHKVCHSLKAKCSEIMG